MNLKTISTVYAIVVRECQNGCTDVRSSLAHITRHHPELVDKEDVVYGYKLRRFLETLNFHAIRENRPTVAVIIQKE